MPDHLRIDEFSAEKSNLINSALPQRPDPCGKLQETQATGLLARLSLSQMTTKRWPITRDLEVCRMLGLKYLGLWRHKYEDIGEETTSALLCEHGVVPSSISWIGGFTGMNGYLIHDTLEESEQVIQYANWVGAKTVVVATGDQGGHILSHATRLVAESLQFLANFAEEKGVHLAVMPMSPTAAYGWTFLNSIRKTEDLLEKCAHPNIGICLNSYHLLQSRHWKSELKNLIPHLRLVRLCDGRSSKRPKMQCLPLQGKMPLLSLLDHLESEGYRGLYEIDTWNDEIWQSSDLAPFQKCVSELTSQYPFQTPR